MSDTGREFLRGITQDDVVSVEGVDPPLMDNLYKWHHPETVEQLCRILGFSQKQKREDIREFLLLAFSAILTATTARRGREHGWFADNTPLAKGEISPPRVDACGLFVNRVSRNLQLLSRYHAAFERSGIDAGEALKQVSVIRANAEHSSPEDYGVQAGSVGGVITSPPYLCMSDYSLGQRLSYGWLNPGGMMTDFNEEIGARRRRGDRPKALEAYLVAMNEFASLCEGLLRSGGYVALVMGAPDPARFSNVDVLDATWNAFKDKGFSKIWEGTRHISWQRNFGLSHLREEKVTVFVKD